MAKRNPSALKAHRQNVKRREHNRDLRSKLRTGLKGIRAALDGGKVDDAKALLARRPRWSTGWPARASSTATPPAATSRG